jgi:hypothetical protein
MNSVTKQCVINRLEMPKEIRDIIKSYCFYDKKTWETIQFIRYKKEQINDLFENKIYYITGETQDYIEDGHWAIGMFSSTVQFQGTNCVMCGNYVQQYAPDYIANKIICNCENDDEEEEDEIMEWLIDNHVGVW